MRAGMIHSSAKPSSSQPRRNMRPASLGKPPQGGQTKAGIASADVANILRFTATQPRPALRNKERPPHCDQLQRDLETS